MRGLPETMESVFADGKEIAPEGFEFITKESMGQDYQGIWYLRMQNYKDSYWDLATYGKPPQWEHDFLYIRPIPEKAEEAKALFLQVVPQTHEEKIAMYMGLPQKDVVEMLINCNTLLESQSGISKAGEAKEVAKPEYIIVSDATTIGLSLQVTEKLLEDFKPWEGLFFDKNGYLYQPMTRNL